MAYLNSELLELFIVSSFAAALFYYFWNILEKERGLRIMTWGITLMACGVALNYLMHTPLKETLASLLGAHNLGYLRPLFYIPGGLMAFIGVSDWFAKVVNYQEEVSLRKQAENEIQDKNELIAEVLNTSKMGILLVDENFIIQICNQRFLDLLQIAPERAHPGTPYRDLIRHMTDQGEYGKTGSKSAYEFYMDLVQSEKHFHFQRRRPNGTILDIEARWIPGIGMLTTYMDVTQQAYAEMELTKSEEKFKDFSASASDWLWELNEDLHFTYVSELGLTLSGRSMDDLQGLSLRELFFEEVTDEQWDVMAAHLNSQKPFKDLRYRYAHPNGAIRYFSSSGKPVFNYSGKFCGYRGIGSDITERRLIEKQLLNSQKMEAIGKLSGGIAHDFNNLLAIIIGNTELLQELCRDKFKEALPKLNIVEKAASRGAELTQQMLSYSRRQKLKPSSVNLVDGLSEIVRMIDRSLGGDIKINLHHLAGLWHAHCDKNRLEDAIINLANNARDAMPSGGELTISTSNFIQENNAGDGEAELLLPGNYVVISVKDTGTGMNYETAAQVFEPFFTTKEVGKGTGLGLSMVFGFAKQSNGHVTIDSQVDLGTTVNLFLPRAVSKVVAKELETVQ